MLKNISRNYKSSSIDVTFKWENISKEKLYTALGENNLRGEILSFESTAFEKNSSGVEKAELPLNKIFKTLTLCSCKAVNKFRKKKTKKKKPWEDQELADLKKTVTHMARKLKRQPYNQALRHNFLKHCN